MRVARLAAWGWQEVPVADEMEFCLLGSLLVRRNAVVLLVQPGKQRALLAALLLNANRVVSVEALAEVLWASEPPASARVSVQNYVKRLRRALADSGRDRISTQPGGYLVSVAPSELDVTRFERLLGAARTSARDGAWATAAAHARVALSLWRGEPLADVGSATLTQREVPRLTELRLQAVETRIDADLHLGRHADVVHELRALAAGHPLRERFHAQLMLALYRDSRQAEALAAYRQARGVLIEELGTEPGSELRTLQQQILTGDPALELPQPAVTHPVSVPSEVPRQLPGPVPQFVGRSLELGALTRLLDEASHAAPATVVISAIGGTAGVGKTALAVCWAHQVVKQFPDGQLYVNLRGYDPGQPMPAADALAAFLRSLGVAGQDIPAEIEERAAKYRSLLAGKHALIVLDNASGVEQVRPLLPGSPGCAVVVTSRDALTGLVARDGAARLELDLLPLQDAVDLLRQLIGRRADADPAAAEKLAGQCARLPLALRVAAELAAARAAPLQDLVAELGDQQRRLSLLDAGGDPRTAVRAVFSWSYRHLDAETARTFRLAGLHPGPDFDPCAVAALTGTTLDRARQMLERLARAHLIQLAAAGRYAMHDLLRTYARELAEGSDGDQQEHAAQSRLFDYYLSSAATAMDIVIPAEAHRRPRIPQPVVGPAMADDADAQAWLDTERANLVAVAVYCAGHGWPRHVTELAATLFRYLMNGCHHPEALTIHGHALQAARQSGDLAAEADALNGLGGIDIMKGHFREAAGHYQAALDRSRQRGDRAGEARVLHNLGMTEYYQHNHQSAARYYRQAVAAYEDIGDGLTAARALADLATAEIELGSYDQASQHLPLALQVLRDAKFQHGEAQALERLGELNLRRGELTEAADFFEQALTIYRRIDNPAGAAAGLASLGEVSLRQGEYLDAISYLRQALALHRQAGYQHGETMTLRSLAEALHGAGQPAAARAELAAALRLAAETGNTYQQASAHRDLAESHHSSGENNQARHHWQQALALYSQLGAPEADHVRSKLRPQGTKAQH
jgi:DNA-binding SARP family transcriptional activator